MSRVYISIIFPSVKGGSKGTQRGYKGDTKDEESLLWRVSISEAGEQNSLLWEAECRYKEPLVRYRLQ